MFFQEDYTAQEPEENLAEKTGGRRFLWVLGQETAAPEDPARAEVLEAVMALEPKYRLAVYLYYYEGLSVAETAAAMKANVSTVQTWLLRARARLRKELSEEKKEESVYVRSEIIP